MATFTVIPRAQAERMSMSRRSAERAEYQSFVAELPLGEAGRLELELGEHLVSVRARLKAAAKAKGVELKIRRRGNVVTFWKQ